MSGVSKPLFIQIDFTRVRPGYLHIFLGLVNDEVSSIRDGMLQLDAADPVLLEAHAAAVEKGEDEEHVSTSSVDGADAPLADDWRGAMTSSSRTTALDLGSYSYSKGGSSAAS